MGAARSTRRPRQPLLGWSLLVEATVWTGLCVWVPLGLWSVGGPNVYGLGSLMWILAAIPVLISGARAFRRYRPLGLPVVVLMCLALTLALNTALSLFVFFLGLGVEPSLGASTRALFFTVSGACALMGTGGVERSSLSSEC